MRRRRRHTFRNVVLVAIASLGLMSALQLRAWHRQLYDVRAYERPTTPIDVVIDKGQTVGAMARTIAKAGLVDAPWKFVWAVRLAKTGPRLQAGEYRVRDAYTPIQLAEFFTRGGSFTKNVTIPEGTNKWQLAPILHAALGLDSAQVIAAIDDSAYLADSLGMALGTAEGVLFPETYKVDVDAKPRDIVRQMVRHFQARVTPEDLARAHALGYDLRAWVTMASMVEEEAKVPAEQPIIAAVYHNRVLKGMLMQCDPTVIYCFGTLDRLLTLDDLQVDCPYNTYKFKGLPPGPISSPGWGALQAALHPANVEYLFFVAQGDGSHYFSTTYEEHVNAIHRIRGTKG